MRTVSKIGVLTLAAALLAADVRAMVPENPSEQYNSIKERNVFGLRPPPALAPQSNPPPQLPKITLTGITTILGNKRALMKVLPIGLKPGETAKELSLILTEGQRESEIEVLQIDEKNSTVKVNNSGTVMLLSFEKDGAKLPATSAPLPTPKPNPLPVAGGVANPYLPAVPAATARKFPGRTPRMPALPPAPGVTGTAAAPVGGVPTPTGLVPATPAQSAPTADPETTAEEQAIIQEIQRQVNANNLALPSPASAPNAAPSTGIEAPMTGAQPAMPAVPQVLVPQ